MSVMEFKRFIQQYPQDYFGNSGRPHINEPKSSILENLFLSLGRGSFGDGLIRFHYPESSILWKKKKRR